jgi:HEAT repeat protein
VLAAAAALVLAGPPAGVRADAAARAAAAPAAIGDPGPGLDRRTLAAAHARGLPAAIGAAGGEVAGAAEGGRDGAAARRAGALAEAHGCPVPAPSGHPSPAPGERGLAGGPERTPRGAIRAEESQVSRPATAETADAVSPEAVAAAVDRLGDLDYTARTRAAQTLRRASPPVAVAALLQAVAGHADGYVRYRALVLLSGFNDPRTREVMAEAMTDPNDRLREVAYAWFEAHPDPSLAPQLIARLETELAEFVRPALVRALAALGADAAVRQALAREAMRGQDFFRSAVIEALGEHKAGYALDTLIEIARLDGPLRDEAALALGRIGERRALPVLAELQRTSRRESQPILAAAICLIGSNCDAHRRFLVETLAFASRQIGYQDLLRSAARGLGALAERGDAEAARALLEAGLPSEDPVRAPIALALGRVALRNPAFVLDLLERTADLDRAILLLRDAFDMLEEDFEEERFFVAVRRAHWQAPEGSAARRVAEKLIGGLDF